MYTHTYKSGSVYFFHIWILEELHPKEWLKMDLATLYTRVRETISSLDFGRIWPGFEPLKFALYSDKECYFDGRYVEKTDEFCANTSILYQGEQIAIWMVQQDLDIPVLTSKIVHEMFHGYQSIMGWDCWPNELEALYRYEYHEENLCLKLRENELLLDLLDGNNESALQEFLALRKRRSLRFPYEFSYESKVEEIEGTANYVEWQVLRQLDENKANDLVVNMRTRMTKPEYLFPVRISSYYTGALMIYALRGAGTYCFDAASRPVILSALKDTDPSKGDFTGKSELIRKTADAVNAFRRETESIIRSAVEKNQVILNGPYELTGVNVYNARCHNGYIASTYFLMYREGKDDKMLQGNFVIKMKDEKTIDRVYCWD